MTKAESRHLALRVMEINAFHDANADLSTLRPMDEAAMSTVKHESATDLIKTMFQLADIIYTMGQQEPNKD